MVKLYLEGGGDAAALKTACREGFAKFLGKAGMTGRMPRIVACGSRADAYDSCHLMVQCMEAWLLADRNTLKQFFGQGFKENALPAITNNLERTSKQQIYTALAAASRDCKTKNAYGKGEHSFKLLALTDPLKVVEASPWAKRFIETLQAKMGRR